MALLEVRDVWFRYGGGSRHVLKGVSLRIDEPSLTLIAGPNGSGKTTLLKVIAGLLTPEKGDVLVQGVRVTGRADLASRLVGLAFQNPLHQFSCESVLEEVRVSMGGLASAEEALRVLRLFGLEGLARRSPFTLSSGEARLLTIASAYSKRPALLLLDEPLTGLDVNVAEGVSQLINPLRNSGTAVVVTALSRFLRTYVRMLMPDKVLILEGGVLKQCVAGRE